MSKILVVDDEEPIVDILTFNLEKEGHDVIVAYDGPSGLQRALDEEPDLILLDIMLPELDGIEVCRRIREKSGTPIIMLTAKDSEIDKVLGLEMGADDYVTKPFGNRELLARVKANLRRHALRQAESPQDILVIGDLNIDRNAFEVKKQGDLVELTHREYELLLYLAEHPGQVMTREHLLQAVWGFDYFGEVRTVDVTIRRLREKIEGDPSNPQIVLTKRGVGYTIAGLAARR